MQETRMEKTGGEKRKCAVGMGEGCESMSLTPVTVCGLLATLSTAVYIPLISMLPL